MGNLNQDSRTVDDEMRVNKTLKLFLVVFMCGINIFLQVYWLPVEVHKTQQKAVMEPLINPVVQETRKNSSSLVITGETFASRVRGFEWDKLLHGDDKEQHWAQLFKFAFETNIMEPFLPVNNECKAPTLPPPNCNVQTLFTGQLYVTPVKIGHAVQIGFDADVFEIHLNEIYDVVDKIFIIEWTVFHNGGIGGTKPLTWEAEV